MSETTRRIHTTILGYFLRGLLLLVPITITIWALFQVLAFLDGIIKLDFPGIGLLTLLAIVTSMVPPADNTNPALFLTKLVGGCALMIGVGMVFYWRAQRDAATSPSSA